MNRRQDLQKYEYDADGREWRLQAGAVLDRRDKGPHGNGEERGEDAADDEQSPPRDREGASGLGQDADEFPLVTCAEAVDHLGSLRIPNEYNLEAPQKLWRRP